MVTELTDPTTGGPTVTYKTVGDLIQELENYDPETPLRVGFQPSWPLAGYIAAVTLIDPADQTECPCGCDGVDEDHTDSPARSEEPATLWIAINQSSSYSESPYAPREIWQ
jgi:hypothetical protein